MHKQDKWFQAAVITLSGLCLEFFSTLGMLHFASQIDLETGLSV